MASKWSEQFARNKLRIAKIWLLKAEHIFWGEAEALRAKGRIWPSDQAELDQIDDDLNVLEGDLGNAADGPGTLAPGEYEQLMARLDDLNNRMSGFLKRTRGRPFSRPSGGGGILLPNGTLLGGGGSLGGRGHGFGGGGGDVRIPGMGDFDDLNDLVGGLPGGAGVGGLAGMLASRGSLGGRAVGSLAGAALGGVAGFAAAQREHTEDRGYKPSALCSASSTCASYRPPTSRSRWASRSACLQFGQQGKGQITNQNR